MSPPRQLTIDQLFEMFPDNAAAERWFEEQRWGRMGRFCPHCGGLDTYEVKNRKPLPYRCRDCSSYFSVRKGTVMEASNLGYRKWAIALYWTVTSPKGTASLRIHRDLGISQQAAWFLMHRIREGFTPALGEDMPGPVEVDETYIGGKARNWTPARKRKMRERAGPKRRIIGKTGKVIMVGIKDRATNKVLLDVVPDIKKGIHRLFIARNILPGTTIYTDDLSSYRNLPYPHRFVCHSKGQYVDGDVHTNGIESFWALFKRGHHGVYHKMSPKHMLRYAAEFEGRFNSRDLPTVERMGQVAQGFCGRRLRYVDLIRPNGYDSDARAVGRRSRWRVRL